MKLEITTLVLLAATVAGCGGQSRTEADFGTSVRVVGNAQVYDEAAALYPDAEAVLGGDPERLNNTLDGHREDVAKPSAVQNPVNINIGGKPSN